MSNSIFKVSILICFTESREGCRQTGQIREDATSVHFSLTEVILPHSSLCHGKSFLMAKTIKEHFFNYLW